MPEHLLQSLEEKVTLLVNELESLRTELSQLKQINASLQIDKINISKKLQGLVSLIEAFDSAPQLEREAMA